MSKRLRKTLPLKWQSRVRKKGGNSGKVLILGRVRSYYVCLIVPAKAFAGGIARRRAVESITKAGVPVPTRVVSLAATDSLSRSSPRRLGKDLSPVPLWTRVAQQKVEVIRDQFRLYVWAAVSSFRRCDSCGTRSCLGSSWGT